MDRTPEFQRDRDYLASLLRELKQRIEEGGGLFHWDLKKFSVCEEALDLAGRLGLARPLFVDQTTLKFVTTQDKRQKEEDEKNGVYDRFGPRSMELASAYQGRVLQSLVFNDPQGGGGQFSNVPHLVVIIDRWIRALDSLNSPLTYPAVPKPFSFDIDDELQSDPLWRHFIYVIDEFDNQEIQDAHWSIGAWPRWVPKLNALAEYDLQLRRPLISVRSEPELRVRDGREETMRIQKALIIQQPRNAEPTILGFTNGSRLDTGSLSEFLDALEAWRDQRELDLLDDHSETGAKKMEPRTKTRTRGRPRTSTLKDDKRVYERWKEAKKRGCTYAEHAREQNIDEKKLKLAVDRHRQSLSRK